MTSIQPDSASQRAYSGELSYSELATVVSSVMAEDQHTPGASLSEDASHLAGLMGEMIFKGIESVPLMSLDDRSLALLRRFHERQRQGDLMLSSEHAP